MTSPVEAIATAVRHERLRKGLSLSELARLASLSKATVSQLEAGTGNPSVETVWALSSALGIPFSQLVTPARPAITVVRAGAGSPTRAEQADYTATLLASCAPQARCDIYRIDAEPGRARESAPHLPGTIEHVVVAAGQASAGPIGEEVTLETGDYVSYRGDVGHIFRALRPRTSAVFVLEQT